MLFDYELLFSDDQDLTGASDENSTNVWDMNGTTSPAQIGGGKEVTVSCILKEDFAGGTGLEIKLVESAAAALTSPNVLNSSGYILLAGLVAGRIINIVFPVERISLRYCGLVYDKTGTFTGTDRITAGITCNQQTSKKGWPATTGFSSPLS